LFGAWKKSGINLGVNYQDSGVVRGVTRGAQFPGAENVSIMSQELSSIQYICFGKTSVLNTGVPNFLLAPGTI